jgi:hypothetical protein
MLNVLVMMLAAWKWGYRGFIPCLEVGLAALVYAKDARLWKPPPDFNIRETISVVTGANSGLGKATALSLARLGSHVIVTCRSLDNTEVSTNGPRRECSRSNKWWACHCRSVELDQS